MDSRNSQVRFKRKKNTEFKPKKKNVRNSMGDVDPNEVLLRLAKPIMLGEETNSVFSPLSLQVILAMIAAGLKGPTQEQLLSFLKSSSIDELNHRCSVLVDLLSDGNPSGSPVVSSVNGLWIDKRVTIKPQFRKVMDEIYKVHSAQVDFQNKTEDACDAVNAWAENETKGRIRDLLTPEHISSLTRLIVANALYFKGGWQDEFDASKTKDRDFHLLNGTTIKAPFMTSKRDQYIGAYDGFKVLRLDYGTEENDHYDYVQCKYRFRSFSMYIFLPDAKNGLSDLVKKLSSRPGFLKSHLPRCQVEVGDFFIPRFKVSSEFKAAEILKDMGLVLPFTGGGLGDVECLTFM